MKNKRPEHLHILRSEYLGFNLKVYTDTPTIDWVAIFQSQPELQELVSELFAMVEHGKGLRKIKRP